mmetsp:Transcript_3888/g.11622  ORF Transcript_3888/g.11622 Transcript_3888/m.11622 type:complete len:278 (-) Transcript_3888:478-1311(-)
MSATLESSVTGDRAKPIPSNATDTLTANKVAGMHIRSIDKHMNMLAIINTSGRCPNLSRPAPSIGETTAANANVHALITPALTCEKKYLLEKISGAKCKKEKNAELVKIHTVVSSQYDVGNRLRVPGRFDKRCGATQACFVSLKIAKNRQPAANDAAQTPHANTNEQSTPPGQLAAMSAGVPNAENEETRLARSWTPNAVESPILRLDALESKDLLSSTSANQLPIMEPWRTTRAPSPNPKTSLPTRIAPKLPEKAATVTMVCPKSTNDVSSSAAEW